MSKKEEFAAVIKLTADMGSSVKSAFDKATGEATKMGKALDLLYAKQGKVGQARSQEQSLERTEKRLEALYARRKKAEAEAAKSSAGKTEAKNLERLTKEIKKAEAASAKQRAEFEKNERQLKRLGLDTANLTKEEEKLGSAIERTDRKSQAAERRHRIGRGLVRAGALGAAVFGAGAAVVGGMFGIDKVMGEDAKNIKNAAGALGLSTDYIQGLRQVGLEAGIAFEKTDAIVTRTTKNIDDALRKGKGNALGYLERLGLNPSSLRGVGMTRAWNMILDAIKNYKGADLGEILTGLGGRGSAKFANVKTGSEGLRQVIAQGLKNGKFMSEETIEKSDEFELAVMKFGGALKGLRNIIGSITLEPFTEAFKTMTQTIGDNAGPIHEWAEEIGKSLKEWVHSGKAKEALVEIGGAIKDTAKFVGGIVDKFGASNVALAGLGVTMGGPLLMAVNPLTVSLVALGAAMLAANKAGNALAGYLDSKADENLAAVNNDYSKRIKAYQQADLEYRDSLKNGTEKEQKDAWMKRYTILQALKQTTDYDPSRDVDKGKGYGDIDLMGNHEYLRGPGMFGWSVFSREKNPKYKDPSTEEAPENKPSPPLLPNSPLLRKPEPVTNNTTNNFHIVMQAAPEQNASSFFDDFMTRMHREFPAAATGSLTQ